MSDPKLKSKELDALFEAVLSLKTREECYMFFEDLCTVAELSAIGQRYKVAQLLHEKNTCNAIAQVTGASTATISRVNKCLHYGTGGYELALKRNEKGN